MKFKWDKKYLYWGITAFLVIAASICFYSLISHGSSIWNGLIKVLDICMPVLDGLVLAYLLDPIRNFIETKILSPICKKAGMRREGKGRSRLRFFSILLTFILAFLFLFGFASMVLPQLLSSIRDIISRFPTYANNLVAWISGILKDNPDIEDIVNDAVVRYSNVLENWLNTHILPSINDLIRQISSGVISFVGVLWDFIIGIILSVYLLASKEKFLAQGKKIIFAILNKKRGVQLIEDLGFVDRTFGGFISGKLLDSLIIGIICFVCISIIGTPYPLLVSVIVGVTNIIPFFGPFLGAIPCIILILMVDPLQALYFLIFILILQQFDGNVLGPKILGNSTGLAGFWVIFAITLFGGLFKVPGMIVGVPLFAVIYAWIRRMVNKSLEKKGMPTRTEEYYRKDKPAELKPESKSESKSE